MKKIALFLLLLTTFSSFSQKIPQGTKFIGGDINFGFQRLKIENLSINNILSLGFVPSFTKFRKDNFSVTNFIGYNIERRSDIPFSSVSRFPNFTTSHGIVLGKYFKNYKMLTEKIGIAAQYGGNIGLSTISYREESAFVPRSERKRNIGRGISLNVGIGASIIYLLNSKMALEGSASLLNFDVIYKKGNNSSTFSASTNSNGSPVLGLGIRYFYKKK